MSIMSRRRIRDTAKKRINGDLPPIVAKPKAEASTTMSVQKAHKRKVEKVPASLLDRED